jgi:hypothetical protein
MLLRVWFRFDLNHPPVQILSCRETIRQKRNNLLFDPARSDRYSCPSAAILANAQTVTSTSPMDWRSEQLVDVRVPAAARPDSDAVERPHAGRGVVPDVVSALNVPPEALSVHGEEGDSDGGSAVTDRSNNIATAAPDEIWGVRQMREQPRSDAEVDSRKGVAEQARQRVERPEFSAPDECNVESPVAHTASHFLAEAGCVVGRKRVGKTEDEVEKRWCNIGGIAGGEAGTMPPSTHTRAATTKPTKSCAIAGSSTKSRL